MGECGKVSGLPSQKGMSLESYRPGVNPYFNAAHQVAMGFADGTGPFLLTLYGPVGVGKTHMAVAIGWAWVAAGAWVIYRQTSRLLDELRACYDGVGDLAFAELMQHFEDCHLLILDDLGVSKPSEWSEDILDRLVDYRYSRQLPLVVATNATYEDLPARLADRLWDVHQGNAMLMKGPSHRGGARP